MSATPHLAPGAENALDALREALPDYARDIRINMSAVMNDTLVTGQQKWGAMVTAAYATGCRALYRAVVGEAQKHITPEACAAARSASAINGCVKCLDAHEEELRRRD